jgi:hypothetical protein
MIVFLVWPRLFDGTPDGLGKVVSARCAGRTEDAQCTVSVLAISPGRFRFEVSRPQADGMILDFRVPPPPALPPKVLLLGAGSTDATVAVMAVDSVGGWRRIDAEEVRGGSRWRGLLRLQNPGDAGLLRVVVQRASPAQTSSPLLLDEAGFLASERGLLKDPRSFLVSLPDRSVYNGILARACVLIAGLGVIATLLLPVAAARRLAPLFTVFLTLAVVTLELWLVYNPYWSRDLRVATSLALQEKVGANLNYGMYLGSRLLQGEGLTYGPGWVPWERMPGYGLLNALGGLLAGFKTDLLTIGVSTIKLHLLLLAIANASFVAAASRLMRPGVAVTVAAVLCFLPNQLSYTQVDSIMVAVYLLTAAALCLFLHRSREGATPPLPYHLAVHLSFALWFLMRADGAVGWAVLSLILYRRAWRYLVLPVGLYLMIGISWGLYKHRYTGEFSMTTFSTGASAWGGLWQVHHKFKWTPADTSYFSWAEDRGFPPQSKRASDAALREVLRFTFTYPVYIAHLMLHKFVKFVEVDALNGELAVWRGWFDASFPNGPGPRRAPLQPSRDGVVGRPVADGHEVAPAWRDLQPTTSIVGGAHVRGPLVWALIGVVGLCLCTGHETRRALFLAWPLLLDLPLFLLLYSSGMRHVAPASAALLAAAVPPLLEPSFYRALLQRRGTTLGVTGMFAASWFLSHWADQALLVSDSWRYWTPLLDPAAFSWYLR